MGVQLQGEALAEHSAALLVKGASKLTVGQSLTNDFTSGPRTKATNG